VKQELNIKQDVKNYLLFDRNDHMIIRCIYT